MNLEDTFRYMVGAYYGVREMDEYPLKEFVLHDIENYVKDFFTNNPIKNFNYEAEAQKVQEERSLKTKLQDALIVLPKVNASMELILLVKRRIKELKSK